MDALLEKIDLNQLDKSTWETFRFEEIAKRVSESVDPNTTDLEIYVGLEHIDPEDIHIKRYGTPDDVSGGKLKCYPGDVIFGKRRAYQRKAAVVDFEGICSAHAFVFRANPKVIDPRLFPFFLHSDQFMHRAVDISVGGLSPTINWGDLKGQEFLLPPKAEQARLAELLWAMDEVIQKEKAVLGKLEKGYKVLRQHLIEFGAENSTGKSKKLRFGKVYEKWPVHKLGSFCSIIGGGAFDSNRFKNSGKYQVLRIGNSTEEGFDLTKAPVFINELSSSDSKYFIPKDSIVLSLTGTNGKRDYGFPSLMESHNVYLLNQRLIMLISDKQIMLPHFLFILTKMELFKRRFFLNATGTANQANVSSQDVAQIELPVPPIEEQQEIVFKLNTLSNSAKLSKAKIAASQALQKSLINQLF